LIQCAVITAVSCAVTFGIGEVFRTTLNLYIRATCAALAHGAFQGGMSAAQGGKFWAGFAAGALSSIASSAIQMGSTGINTDGTDCVTNFGATINKPAVILATGAIMGGAGSAIGGGNFWQGAVTGLVVAGFNHLMHMGSENNRAARAVKHLKGAPTPGNEAIQTVVDIDDIASDYSSGGSPKVGSQIKYVANTTSPDYANTDMNNGNISVYKKSFTSWKTLYLKVTHELSHRFDYVSKSYAGWANSYGKNYAKAVSETYAYDREAWWDGGNQGAQLNSFSEIAKARLYNYNFKPQWRQ
jgi:hypothetical protein